WSTSPLPVYSAEEGTAGRLAAWRACKKWSRCGQLPDTRTITRRARDHFRRHFDQSGPPRAGETSTQGVALTALVEELLARRFVERFGRQLGRQAQFGGRRCDFDDRVSQPHQQVQRGGVQVEPEQVRQEPVVAEPAGMEFDLELLVPVLALAAHRVRVVDRGRKDP